MKARMLLVMGAIFWSHSLLPKPKKIDFQVINSTLKTLTYKEACKVSGKSGPLISSPSPHYLDCMGEKVKVSKTCLRKWKKELSPSLSFLRGFAVKDKVFCQWGESATLSIQCGKENRLCQKKKKTCLKLKKIYANSLFLDNAHIVRGFPGRKKLNCYYFGKNLFVPLKN